MYLSLSTHSVLMRNAILGITWERVMNNRYWYYSRIDRAWLECSQLTYLLGKKTGWPVAEGKENA